MKIYAVHQLSWLLDECETELFANKSKALETFNALLASYHDYIRKIYSQSDEHIYFEGKYDENIKILFEEITLQWIEKYTTSC